MALLLTHYDSSYGGFRSSNAPASEIISASCWKQLFQDGDGDDDSDNNLNYP